MKKWSFISRKRLAISFISSVVFVFYSFYTSPVNNNLLASRTFTRQIFDYVINISLFLAVIYLILALMSFVSFRLFYKK